MGASRLKREAAGGTQGAQTPCAIKVRRAASCCCTFGCGTSGGACPADEGSDGDAIGGFGMLPGDVRFAVLQGKV